MWHLLMSDIHSTWRAEWAHVCSKQSTIISVNSGFPFSRALVVTHNCWTFGMYLLSFFNLVRKAQVAFGAVNKIWHSTTYSMQTKLHIFNTNMKAVLLYGCETWKNSKYITTKLQVFINKSLRKILRIFWPDRITNNELWKHTKQPRIDLQIRKCKWGWLGHTLRKPIDDITRQALEWNPQGKRCRGRPKNTWRRTVLEEAKGVKKTWAEIKCIAKNRVRWRNLVDALCFTAEWWDYWLIELS